MADQLLQYHTQLDEVNLLLQSDPPNLNELLDLKKDLEELIQLIESSKAETPILEAEKKQTHIQSIDAYSWKIGDECEVREPQTSLSFTHNNSEWIKCCIISISADRTQFTVKSIQAGNSNLKQQGKMYVVSGSEIRQVYKRNQLYGMIEKKNGAGQSKESSAAIKLKRQKQKEKFFTKQEVEQQGKQSAWKSFQNSAIKANVPAASMYIKPHQNIYQKPSSQSSNLFQKKSEEPTNQ